MGVKLSFKLYSFRTLRSLVTRYFLPFFFVFIPSATDIGLAPSMTLNSEWKTFHSCPGTAQPVQLHRGPCTWQLLGPGNVAQLEGPAHLSCWPHWGWPFFPGSLKGLGNWHWSLRGRAGD